MALGVGLAVALALGLAPVAAQPRYTPRLRLSLSNNEPTNDTFYKIDEYLGQLVGLGLGASGLPNRFWATPDGVEGVPAFRALVPADIPALDAGKITTGVFGAARLPDETTERGNLWVSYGAGGDPFYVTAESPLRAWADCGDGSVDRSTQVQAAIDELAARTPSGGVLVMDPSATCLVKDLVPKANVVIRCGRNGSGFKLAGSATTGLFVSTATGGSAPNNSGMIGCTLDLNAQRKPAYSTQEGNNQTFESNYVSNPGTGSGAGYDLVRIGCTMASAAGTAKRCTVTGNTIVGSGTDAANDTCLHVEPTATGFSEGANLIAGNVLSKCGGHCLSVDAGQANILGNTTGYCDDAGFDVAVFGSLIEGNEIAGTKGRLRFRGPYLCTNNAQVTCATDADCATLWGVGGTCNTGAAAGAGAQSNNEIVGNRFPVQGPTLPSIWATGTSVGGLRVVENYIFGGVVFDVRGTCSGAASRYCDTTAADCTPYGAGTCTLTGVTYHNQVQTNVIHHCDGTRPACVYIDNPVDVQVSENFVIVDAGGIGVRFVDQHSAGAADMHARITDNIFGGDAATAAIRLEGGGAVGIDRIQILDNTLSGTFSQGLALTGITTATGLQVHGNRFTATTPLSGWVRSYGTLDASNLGVTEFRDVRTASSTLTNPTTYTSSGDTLTLPYTLATGDVLRIRTAGQVVAGGIVSFFFGVTLGGTRVCEQSVPFLGAATACFNADLLVTVRNAGTPTAATIQCEGTLLYGGCASGASPANLPVVNISGGAPTTTANVSGGQTLFTEYYFNASHAGHSVTTRTSLLDYVTQLP